GEPFPDRLDPAAVVVERDSMRLAMVAALQYLAPRQRAVLLLRDVLGWRTPEVAALLGVSTIAVNSLLQRAREQLARVSPEAATEPAEAERRALLERYVAAFERTDVDELVKLLTADATWEMPPRPAPLYGVAAITEAIVRLCPSWGGKALVPVGANGQPAFAVYSPGPDGCLRAHSVQVLTLTRAGISRVVAFHDPWLFAGFDLPMRLVGASA
ncbi:MAG: RNA polymerase subunit sigma-70, partial [Nonomuraea sp.]|nr:RNA polymerase subunit sigma-70 [Nonomuraea sp.]